jgi:hypothetical protein
MSKRNSTVTPAWPCAKCAALWRWESVGYVRSHSVIFWFPYFKAGVFVHRKAGATFEFMERFCKWSKTSIILMFISAFTLFILPLKFKIDNHHEEIYLLCRWTKGLCENIGNGIKYMVIMTVGVRIFPLNIFILCIIIDVEIWFFFKTAYIKFFIYIYDHYMCWDWQICILFGI